MLEKVKNLALISITALFLFVFSVWGLLKPDDRESFSERRPLASFPAVSGESIFSGEFMESFEKYTLDQFPLREQFRSIKAMTAFYVFRQKDNNDIYVKDGYISKLEYPMDTESIQYAANRFRFIYDTFVKGKNMKVYLSLIPDKNYFMAKENGYPSIDYEAFISEVKQRADFAEYIDIWELLELEDYYRTDSHWRQEKILKVARRLADTMGVPLKGEYIEKQITSPFYGVYYGQSALPLEADTICYLENANMSGYKVYDYEENRYIPVYDFEKSRGNDPYEMFLSGSKSLLTIENPDPSAEKELIVFRDSFGSSLAPLLAAGYKKITLVDIRYISPAMLDRFVDFSGQDVLFLYNISVLNNSITIK